MKKKFIIVIFIICAIVVMQQAFYKVTLSKNTDSDTTTVKKEETIYFLKDKLFYFQVILDNKIIDTIYLKTYSKLLQGQGQISWIYDFKNTIPKEFWTGVVEDDSVIWLHPPREFLYEIFQIVSFPHVVKPYEVNNKWNWNLSISDKFVCKQWDIYWKGFLKLNFKYEITGREVVSVMDQNLECFIIKAETDSSIGSARAVMSFHPKLGFVKLNYPNLYGHEMSITLFKVLDFSPENPNWFQKDILLRNDFKL